jgi:4,5-dihydroxyphthalate decarboxylase
MSRKLRLFFREPTIDTNRPISSGRVGIEGFEVEFVDRLKSADVWDCSFAKRLSDFGPDCDCISIPVFPNRKFRHSYIFVSTRSGIDSPCGLEGKRIGIKSWSNTAGVWCRGILRNYYGVDAAQSSWIALERDDDVGIPDGALRIEYRDAKSGGGAGTQTLDELLLAGEIDAVIDPNVPASIIRKDGRTRRLFQNYYEEERRWFADTGIFPTSHIVTLRRDFVDANPDAPRALLRAWRKARDIAFEAVEGADPETIIMPWLSHHLEEQRALMGERFFCYDIAHAAKALDALMLYARQQWLTSELVDKTQLFHPSTLNDLDE